MNDDALDLSRRTALPAELLDLLKALPRAAWQQAPGFGGLAAFWLDRHLGFRRLLGQIGTEAEAVATGRMSPEEWRRRLMSAGGRLVAELEGHHRIEDEAYFPQMIRLERRLLRGFDLLEMDHAALDVLLDGFTRAANGAMRAKDVRTAAHRFRDGLVPFERQLVRHLSDEEDLIIPVILKHGVE